MKQKYAYQGSGKVARALGKSLPISTKQSVEVCRAIRGEKVSRARTMLEAAAEKKEPIRFTRFTEGAGHKSGGGAGKYPVKACTHIIKILNSAEANAQDQGLGADLVVEHAAAQQGSRSYKYGRHTRRKEKRTHIEIIVREATGEKKTSKKKSKKSKTKKSKKDSKKKKKTGSKNSQKGSSGKKKEETKKAKENPKKSKSKSDKE